MIDHGMCYCDYDGCHAAWFTLRRYPHLYGLPDLCKEHEEEYFVWKLFGYGLSPQD